MNNMQVIDIIFIVLIVLLVIHGYVRGFIKELFSWAALVLAVIAAVLLHPPGAELIRERVMPNVRYVPELLSFVGIFIIVVTLCKLLEHILRNVISGANLGGLDKILGAAFGFVEGIAITALILFVLSVQPLFDVSNIIRESAFAQFILPHLSKLPLEMGRDALNIVLFGKGISGV